MMKRTFSLLVVLLMLASVLAACGGTASEQAASPPVSDGQTSDTGTSGGEETPASDQGGSDQQTPTDAEATEPAADQDQPKTGEKPSDPIGVVEIGPNDPIVMAYALVTSGPNAALGTDMQRGIEIAIDDAGGELLGHEIRLEGEDTLCSPDGGQAAGTKLSANPQVVGVVGATCSSATRVLAPLLSQAGIALISPSSTAPELTDPATHEKVFLRTAHNDEVQGRAAAEFALQELGVTKAATIHDGSNYAEQLANVFAENFKAGGGEIVAQEAVNEGDTDMRPVLTTIAAAQPELIYYPIFTAEGGFITRQARDVSGLENTKLMGADGLFSAEFVDAAGDAAIGMYLSSPDFSAFGDIYKEFLNKYQEQYGEAPLSTYHAHSYDAANLIFKAIKEVAVQGEDGTLWIPRQALLDALYAAKDYQGITGNLTCSENGDCADPHIAVYEVTSSDTSQWQEGVVTKIWPQ